MQTETEKLEVVEIQHKALIEKARRYDRKAQGKLYELYYKAMYNTSLRMLNDSAKAEDVMQESFIDAFRSLHQFKGDATFGAWLKRIVVNRSINHLKKEQRLQELAIVAQEVQEEEVEMETDFSIEEIKACLPKLATNYSLVFNLYLIEGYDHEEISEILGISSATSRSQLSRAKKRIRELLNKKK